MRSSDKLGLTRALKGLITICDGSCPIPLAFLQVLTQEVLMTLGLLLKMDIHDLAADHLFGVNMDTYFYMGTTEQFSTLIPNFYSYFICPVH
jgi:hypothetical protein